MLAVTQQARNLSGDLVETIRWRCSSIVSGIEIFRTRPDGRVLQSHRNCGFDALKKPWLPGLSRLRPPTGADSLSGTDTLGDQEVLCHDSYRPRTRPSWPSWPS
jgi:hypothetical protein